MNRAHPVDGDPFDLHMRAEHDVLVNPKTGERVNATPEESGENCLSRSIKPKE